jgi:hypothetical protein
MYLFGGDAHALDYNNPELIAKALTLVYTYLKMITSVNEIIVQMHNIRAHRYMKRIMKSQGWEVTWRRIY